jgi:hypothetical protein
LAVVIANPAFAILGLPDNFNNNGDSSSNNNTDTQQAEEPQTQTQTQPIEGFLTHHDPKSLFSIQYPSDWRVLGNTSGHISFSSPLDPTYKRKTTSLSIQVTNQSTGIRNLTLDQVVNNFKNGRTGYMNFKETVGEESDMTLSGIPARKIVTQNSLSGLSTEFFKESTIRYDYTTILAVKGSNGYEIHYIVGEPDDESIIQQMIDSFRITS